MGDKDALKKIEKAIEKIAARQDEICAAVASLEQRMAAAAPPPETQDVLKFLDQFRAGEAFGEETLGAWIDVCTTDCLKGGLRVIAQREGMHARLLEERLVELGGRPEAEVPAEVRERGLKQSGSTEKTDVQKLQDFVAQFPDVDKALQPIVDMADRLDSDPETQSLLRSICQDERSTLVFLSDACAQLSGV